MKKDLIKNGIIGFLIFIILVLLYPVFEKMYLEYKAEKDPSQLSKRELEQEINKFTNSGQLDCAKVINSNMSRGVSDNFTKCLDDRDMIEKLIRSKYSLTDKDVLIFSILKSDPLNETYKVSVNINCKEGASFEVNQGCSGVEFFNNTNGIWVNRGFNDDCLASLDVCKKIENIEG